MQRFNGNSSDSSESWPAGFGIEASIPLARSVSLVGQFDWSHKSESFTFDDGALEIAARISTYAAGLRWTSRNPDARVLAQVLGGGMRLSAGCKIDGVDCRSVSDEELSETYGIVDVGGDSCFRARGLGALLRVCVIRHRNNIARIRLATWQKGRPPTRPDRGGLDRRHDCVIAR